MSTGPSTSFRSALSFWLRLGFISFGGPAGQIAIMHEYLVEKKKWLSEEKFLHALNYCMLLPGPEAQQLASYCGWLLHGKKGGLAAGILFVLPSVIILSALSVIYVLYGTTSGVTGILYGLKPAVVAIVFLALYKIGKKSLNSTLHWIIAVCSFIAVYALNVPVPLLLLGALFAGFITNRNKFRNSSNFNFEWQTLLKEILLFAVIWSVPFILTVLILKDTSFWKELIFFFSKTAVITFGGAYAILPYVQQVTIEHLKWITSEQMFDGLALGESTPGPLIMVLTFVGFLSGYNRYGTISMGLTGLLLTTFYTFLPSFLFIFAGAPLIEKSEDNPQLKKILTYTSAVVTGIIFNLAIYLAISVTKNKQSSIDYHALGWVIASLFALKIVKINLIIWIVISGITGYIFFLTK